MYPSAYRYSKEHEWIHVEDAVATIGITSFAQDELGEVVYVELPEAGDQFDAGDEIGSIESVKAVAEVYTPLAGEVVEVNAGLDDKPEAVNDEPHGGGWLIKLRIDPNDAVLATLMDADAYATFANADA